MNSCFTPKSLANIIATILIALLALLMQTHGWQPFTETFIRICRSICHCWSVLGELFGLFGFCLFVHSWSQMNFAEENVDCIFVLSSCRSLHLFGADLFILFDCNYTQILILILVHLSSKHDLSPTFKATEQSLLLMYIQRKWNV